MDFKNVFEKVKDFANKAKDATVKFTEKATEEAKRLTEIGKIKLRIAELEKEREAKFAMLGQLYYEYSKNKRADFEEKAQLYVKDLDDIERMIEDLKRKMEALSQSVENTEKGEPVVEKVVSEQDSSETPKEDEKNNSSEDK